jgi:hypothetical protein
MHEMFDICGNVAALRFAGRPAADARASTRPSAKGILFDLTKLGSPAPCGGHQIIPPAIQARRKPRAA